MATVLEQPLVHFGPEIGADLANGLRREWLVTKGIGGYASGTISGINTRRYHGLLVAALVPPVERTVLVGGCVDWATYDGRRYPLCAHEYGDGTIDRTVLEVVGPYWRWLGEPWLAGLGFARSVLMTRLTAATTAVRRCDAMAPITRDRSGRGSSVHTPKPISACIEIARPPSPC
jgi:glycogen debranching enzyme